MSQSLPAPPAPPREGPARSPRSRRRLAWSLAVVGGLVLVGAAVAVLARSSAEPTDAAPAPSVATELVAVAPPTGLRASAGPFRVVLRWRAPAGSTAPLGYLIYRDGDLVRSQREGTSFVDGDVLPATNYRYEVEAFDASIHHSAPISVQVKTPTAPASSARLQGVFNVRLVKTSSYGVTGIAAKDTAGWRFTPKCAADPCDVTWADIHWKDLSAVMQRDGGRYEGSTAVRGYLECSGTQSSSSIHLTIHLTKADGVAGEWRGTAFEGTMTVYNAAQLGCRSSQITYDVTGAIAR